MMANDGITVTFRYRSFCYMFHFVPLCVFDFVAFPLLISRKMWRNVEFVQLAALWNIRKARPLSERVYLFSYIVTHARSRGEP